jgi:thiosulfate dehydrogenase [quinone] large subunit
MRWLDFGLKIPMEYFALIRIALGLCFLTNAIEHLRSGYLTGEGLSRYIEAALRSPFPDPVYRGFLQDVVMPNAPLFGNLLVWGEWAVALLLILGLGTRLAAAGALFLTLNYWLSNGVLNVPALHRSFVVIALAVLLAMPGVVWGLDRLLLGRAPAWLIGRPEQLPLDRLHAVGPLGWAGLSGFATQLNYLALIRIVIGLSYFVAGYTKLMFLNVLTDTNFVFTSWERYTQVRDPLAQAWLDLVGANYSLFAPLIIAGEMTAGVLLFFGLFTRVGAAIGIWHSLNYMWMKGWSTNDAFLDRGWLVCEIVILAAGAGLALGLDGVLRRFLPRWLTGVEKPELAAPPAAPAPEPLGGA